MMDAEKCVNCNERDVSPPEPGYIYCAECRRKMIEDALAEALAE